MFFMFIFILYSSFSIAKQGFQTVEVSQWNLLPCSMHKRFIMRSRPPGAHSLHHFHPHRPPELPIYPNVASCVGWGHSSRFQSVHRGNAVGVGQEQGRVEFRPSHPSLIHGCLHPGALRTNGCFHQLCFWTHQLFFVPSIAISSDIIVVVAHARSIRLSFVVQMSSTATFLR